MGATEVTPAKRRARLRKAALLALQRYDIDVRRVRLLLNEFNCTFRVEAADGAEYVLRIASERGCHGEDETRAEMAWLHALRRDTDLIVPRPVVMADGAFVGRVDPGLAPGYRQHVLFEWIPGSTIGDRGGRATAAKLGACMASLHEHAATFELPDGCRARIFDRAFPYADERFEHCELVMIFDDEFRGLYTPALRRAYERAIEVVDETTERLFASAEKPRLIHNDLHLWNALAHRGQVAPIDFEDLMWGFPVQDVATTLYYLRCREDGGAAHEAAYRAGYETVAPWPARDEQELTACIAGRGLILANTVATEPDPAERARLASIYIRRIGERLKRWMAATRP